MPVYSVVCPKCGAKDERVRAMKDVNKACMCTCGTRMNRDFAADLPFASGGDYGARAIHSDSLAIAPSQRAEHEKLFSNIKLDAQCRPIFDNYRDHQNYLNKCNLVKERKKIKPRGKRIA